MFNVNECSFFLVIEIYIYIDVIVEGNPDVFLKYYNWQIGRLWMLTVNYCYLVIWSFFLIQEIS